MASFSIVIPLYNEAIRLTKTIDEIFSFFKGVHQPVQIIFVNDGSLDDTVSVLESYRETYAFILVSYPINRGKGYAVRQGVKAATGEWIVFFDIDLATPLSEFTHLVETMQDQDAVIIGSRRLEGAAIKKSESWLRTTLGHGFTLLSNILVPRVTDFTCGFKCFSRSSATDIFDRARVDRWGFDTELLYIAKLRGWTIREMPVTWAHDQDSRVRVGKAIASSLRELWQIVYYRMRGYYR